MVKTGKQIHNHNALWQGVVCYEVKEKGATTKQKFLVVPTLSVSLQPNKSMRINDTFQPRLKNIPNSWLTFSIQISFIFKNLAYLTFTLKPSFIISTQSLSPLNTWNRFKFFFYYIVILVLHKFLCPQLHYLFFEGYFFISSVPVSMFIIASLRKPISKWHSYFKETKWKISWHSLG